jgi:hypothetical protein
MIRPIAQTTPKKHEVGGWLLGSLACSSRLAALFALLAGSVLRDTAVAAMACGSWGYAIASWRC